MLHLKSLQSPSALHVQASMMSLNAEANVHSADWLMSIFVSELGSQDPAPCTQSKRSVRATVLKDY